MILIADVPHGSRQGALPPVGGGSNAQASKLEAQENEDAAATRATTASQQRPQQFPSLPPPSQQPTLWKRSAEHDPAFDNRLETAVMTAA